MKKYIKIILGAILATGISISCEKSETPFDYEATIKDKTWWGTFNYNGKSIEYYSVNFKADHSFLWSQYSGDYPGTWIINENQLKLTFPTMNSTIQATITDEGKMMNFSDDIYETTILTGDLIRSMLTTLDNTVWKGIIKSGYSERTFNLRFLPESTLEINSGGPLYTPVEYTISAPGIIREVTTGTAFFGIVISESIMYGSDSDAMNTYQVAKQ